MKIILLIGCGSFMGGILRYFLSQFVQSKHLSSFPLGTWVVNIIGCLLIGIVFAISERTSLPQEWRLFMMTGFLGGFTTFSAFSNETIGLISNGQPGYASLYVALSVAVGLLATWLGISLVRIF